MLKASQLGDEAVLAVAQSELSQHASRLRPDVHEPTSLVGALACAGKVPADAGNWYALACHCALPAKDALAGQLPFYPLALAWEGTLDVAQSAIGSSALPWLKKKTWVLDS